MSVRRVKVQNLSREAIGIYKDFKARSGSGHIAKPVTLEVLLRICRGQKPRRILELGGGLELLVTCY